MHVTSVIKDGSDDGYDVTADVFGWKKGREFLYKKIIFWFSLLKLVLILLLPL